jgi:uncharacterized protein (DUF736 family)
LSGERGKKEREMREKLPALFLVEKAREVVAALAATEEEGRTYRVATLPAPNVGDPVTAAKIGIYDETDEFVAYFH